MPSAEQMVLFKSILKVLQEQSEALGHTLTNQQILNLTFAFRKVLPENLDELSVVIALGLQQKPTQEVVSEYLRKRNRDTVSLPYGKIRNAQKALEKSWGLLLYKEQADALLSELTGRLGDLPSTVFFDIDVLIECLRKDYREKLFEKEIEKIHKDLRQYTKIGMNSYAWCLEIAKQVLKGIEEDKN